MRIRVDSVGCRLNISELEEMARRFAAAGHRLVGPGEIADLYVLIQASITFQICLAIGSARLREFTLFLLW